MTEKKGPGRNSPAAKYCGQMIEENPGLHAGEILRLVHRQYPEYQLQAVRKVFERRGIPLRPTPWNWEKEYYESADWTRVAPEKPKPAQRSGLTGAVYGYSGRSRMLSSYTEL